MGIDDTSFSADNEIFFVVNLFKDFRLLRSLWGNRERSRGKGMAIRRLDRGSRFNKSDRSFWIEVFLLIVYVTPQVL